MDKRASHISTFNGGMDRDTNFANIAKEKYYELKNGRVVVNNYSNSFSVTPFKQPGAFFTLPQDKEDSFQEIIGSVLVRNGDEFQLVIFTTGNADIIWLVKDLDSGAPTVINIWQGLLGFNREYLVEGVSKYETPHNIKVYFWDNLNQFRYVNIGVDTFPLTLTADQFDTVPTVSLEQPKYIKTIQGVYKSGKVQYAYRLYNNNGNISSLSPLSGMVHLTGPNMSENGNNLSYMGSAYDTTTSMGVQMLFDNLPTTLNRIKIYAIHYQQVNIAPVIKLLVDDTYSGDYTLIDTGNVSGSSTITVDELLFENYIPIPKTGVTKHNTLYLGNINKKTFDDASLDNIDFRAFRFSGKSPVWKNLVLDNNEFSQSLNSLSDISLYIGKEFDCYQSKTTQYSSKYKFNENVLGGSGLFIDYEFFTKKIYLGQNNSQVNSQFTLSTLNTSQTSDNYPVNNSFGGYESASIDYVNGGYCRDEVYAFAIVFRDNKGFKSFPKWIGDIKMPAMRESDSKNANFKIIGDPYYNDGYILGVKFTLKNINTILLANPNIVSWEIVRMNRKPEDRSIVCQGVAFGIFSGLNGGGNRYMTKHKHGPTTWLGSNSWSSPRNGDQYHNVFITPDFYFNGKLLPFAANDELESIGCYLADIIASSSFFYPCTKTYQLAKQLFLTPNNKHTLLKTNPCIWGIDAPIDTNIFVAKWTSKYSDSTDEDENPGKNWRGSVLGVRTNTELATNTAIYNNSRYHLHAFNYIRNIENAYGGHTYSSRFNRQYYSTMNSVLLQNAIIPGPIPIPISSSQSAMVLGGDIYITRFDYLAQMFGYEYNGQHEENYTKRYQHNIYFPVESVYNTALRHGYIESKENPNYGPLKDEATFAYNDQKIIKVCMEDPCNLYSGDDVDHDISEFQHNQALPYYIYNTIYSQYPLLPVYVPKPRSFDLQDEFDARIIYSNTKITGESVDSWLIFAPLNFKDLDYEYGPINKLIKFKDNVFSLQTKALAAISINPRVALQGDIGSGLPVQLGNGGKFDRFDYISTKYGCFHRFGAISTEHGLYYFDATNKKIMLYSGNPNVLSDMKGMYSFINSEVPEDLFTLDSGKVCQISLHYDQVNNDMIVYFNKNDREPFSKMITFNELLGGFHSINSFNLNSFGSLFLESNKKILLGGSYPLNNDIPLVLKYDNVFDPNMDTELTVVINTQYTDRKVFDNLYFDIDIYEADTNKDINYVHTPYSGHDTPAPITDYIKSIQFYNDYQNTGIPELKLKQGWSTNPYAYNLSKVEREYMYQIPGNDIIDPSDSILDPENTYLGQKEPIHPLPTFRDRMRGKYVVCKIILKPEYDNYPENKESLKVFALNYLKTLMRLSY